MTKTSFLRRAVRCWATSLPLLVLLPTGCTPIDAAGLADFSLDFARSALAAWVL